jgi:ribokinase
VGTPSGTACIVVNDAGINEIIVASGANLDVTPNQVRAALAAKPRVVLCQLEIPMLAVEAASEAERFILNPAPSAHLPDSVVSRCFLLTPNEGELAHLTGLALTDEASLKQAGEMLLDRGVENVVVTLGERGSYWVSRAGGKHFDAPKVDAVDTTGAGDAFNGALAVFLDEGVDLGDAIPMANRVGALSATRKGAQPSMPNREELEQMKATV